MNKTRKKYAREFKNKAVELSNQRGSVVEIAEELGIRSELIYRWRKEQQDYTSNSFPGNGIIKQTEEQRELSKLRKALSDMKMERDILKKAISIFSVSDGKSTNL